MLLDPQDVFAEALKLPARKRAELARTLLESLDEEDLDGTPEEIYAAWSEEIKRRIEDLDSGRVKAVPWEEACRRIFSDDNR